MDVDEEMLENNLQTVETFKEHSFKNFPLHSDANNCFETEKPYSFEETDDLIYSHYHNIYEQREREYRLSLFKKKHKPIESKSSAKDSVASSKTLPNYKSKEEQQLKFRINLLNENNIPSTYMFFSFIFYLLTK